MKTPDWLVSALEDWSEAIKALWLPFLVIVILVSFLVWRATVHFGRMQEIGLKNIVHDIWEGTGASE